MPKRIHKRPGSEAWKKSLKRSASRMEKSLIRISDSDAKHERVLKNYFKNKTQAEQKILKRLIAEAGKRRASLIGKLREREKALSDKNAQMVKGYNRLLKIFDNNRSIENASTLINTLRTMIDVSLERIGKLEYLGKTSLQTERKGIRIKIGAEEHYCVYLLRKLLEVERIRDEMESEQ